MTDRQHTSTTPLPLPLPPHLYPVCDRFQTAWAAASGTAERPRIEDYLDGVFGPVRTALLRELLAREVFCRCRRGEVPGTEEYHQRFPELDLAWLGDEL